MKTTLTIPAMLFAAALSAQCTFTPTVSPTDLMLCPFQEAMLETETYDSYQWYRDGELIPDATERTITVSSEDAANSFSVEATLDGCTEMSAGVLVDGWAFLLPYAIHAGDPPLYIAGEGIQHNCAGDTVLLILNYQTNVRWFRNGAVLEGQTDDTLVIVQNGDYTAEGAPSICPDFVMGLGVNVAIRFDEPVQPTLSVGGGGQLCAEPEGVAYQWYLNGAPLAGDQPCIDVMSAGSYTVVVTYDPDCSVPSAPYLATSIGSAVGRAAAQLFPVPANDRVTVRWSDGTVRTPWELVDMLGRRSLEGSRNGSSEQVIDISMLPNGRYWLRSTGERPLVLDVLK